MRCIRTGSLTLLVGGTRLEREERMGNCQSAADFVSALAHRILKGDDIAFMEQMQTLPRFALSEMQDFDEKPGAKKWLSDILIYRQRQELPTVLGMSHIPAFLKKLFPIPYALIPSKIYLLEQDPRKCKFLKLYFEAAPEAETVCDDFRHFMETHRVQCAVSPANAFGLMDSGYDLAITEWFGEALQQRVQQYIIDHFYGEQPVGTSFLIDTGKDDLALIHTPTMRTPQPILDARVVYQCMRATLMCAAEHSIESIVIPLFGSLSSGIRPQLAADMMWRAYRQLKNPPERIDWEYVEEIDIVL